MHLQFSLDLEKPGFKALHQQENWGISPSQVSAPCTEIVLNSLVLAAQHTGKVDLNALW